MDSALNAIAALLGLAAVFGYLNHRFLKLPQTIGLVVIALLASLAALGLDALAPSLGVGGDLREGLAGIDFSETLMQGLLSFLLFAGALHVDLGDLRERGFAIATMATIGVITSTFLVGTGAWAIFQVLGLGIPYIYCLVFGALISPTDPVAVLGILKSVRVPRTLEAKIAGESLFNDGVGIVIFIIVVALAVGGGDHGGEAALGVGGVIELFLREALGGAVLGLVAGLIAFFLMRSIDEHNLEVIITLALVTVTYQIATALGISGPIAVVVAGLLMGNHGMRLAMSEKTRAHLVTFWELIDEILNAVLFLLIGLEVLLIPTDISLLWAVLLTIPLVLASRFVSVSIPITILGTFREFTRGAIPVLTWGGIRGGISVALALSLPDSPERDIILAVTYGVVLFSIIGQGLTIGALVKRMVPPSSDEN
jgi:CPA1 family monovalent cation:H+ antiporter